MSVTRIIGLVVLVVGVALLIIGWNAANTLTEEVHETFTGRFTESTTWYIIGGIAATVGGALLAIFGGQRQST